MHNPVHYLCIYHDNCLDGFGAAWVVQKLFNQQVAPYASNHPDVPTPTIEFYAAKYQQPPPDVTDKKVVIVDFSYPKSVLLEMAAKARLITVIDHHEGMAKDLQELADENAPINIIFRPDKSGALLTWEYYFPGTEAPRLIQHISDRDLWQWKLADTLEICTALQGYAKSFAVWDKFMTANDLGTLKTEGRALVNRDKQLIDSWLKDHVIHRQVAGVRVPVANIPKQYASEVGNILAEGHPFSVTYMDTVDGRVFSLRSKSDGANCFEIAKRFGGGGHRNAAGFTIAAWENEIDPWSLIK